MRGKYVKKEQRFELSVRLMGQWMWYDEIYRINICLKRGVVIVFSVY